MCGEAVKDPVSCFGLDLRNVLLQRPVSGSVAVWIGVIALLIYPRVVEGAGIFGDKTRVGIKPFLLIQRLIAPVVCGLAPRIHVIRGILHGALRSFFQTCVEIFVLLLT
jgi:hypothetical protein